MYTTHNGENAVLRIFFFIPQWQRIQPNFMYHTYQATKQTNTNRKTNTTAPSRVSYSNFSISLFVHFIHHQFVHLINPSKPVSGLMNSLVHFIHLYMNLLPIPVACIPTLIPRIPPPIPTFSPSFPAFLSFLSPIPFSDSYI